MKLTPKTCFAQRGFDCVLWFPQLENVCQWIRSGLDNSKRQLLLPLLHTKFASKIKWKLTPDNDGVLERESCVVVDVVVGAELHVCCALGCGDDACGSALTEPSYLISIRIGPFKWGWNDVFTAGKKRDHCFLARNLLSRSSMRFLWYDSAHDNRKHRELFLLALAMCEQLYAKKC